MADEHARTKARSLLRCVILKLVAEEEAKPWIFHEGVVGILDFAGGEYIHHGGHDFLRCRAETACGVGIAAAGLVFIQRDHAIASSNGEQARLECVYNKQHG